MINTDKDADIIKDNNTILGLKKLVEELESKMEDLKASSISYEERDNIEEKWKANTKTLEAQVKKLEKEKQDLQKVRINRSKAEKQHVVQIENSTKEDGAEYSRDLSLKIDTCERMIESKTGEAEPNFICDECTFETSTETNLKKHKAKEHKTRLEKHNEALEEEKIKDRRDLNEIEELLRECEKDMRDEDEED